MAGKRKINDYGTGIPYHEVEALARVLLPEIQAFFRERGRAAGVCRVEGTAGKGQGKTEIAQQAGTSLRCSRLNSTHISAREKESMELFKRLYISSLLKSSRS